MQIRTVSVDGFRSLRGLRLTELGVFNVFYGQNGSGKSNILQAIKLSLRLLGHAWRSAAWGNPVGAGEFVRRDDFWQPGGSEIRLGLEVVSTSTPLFGLEGLRFDRLDVELLVERVGEGTFLVRLVRMVGGWAQAELDILPVLKAPDSTNTWSSALAAGWGDTSVGLPDFRRFHLHFTNFVCDVFARELFQTIPATRELRPESRASNGGVQAPRDVRAELDAGYLARAILAAATNTRPSVLRGYERLRSLLSGPPLHRGRLSPVYVPETDSYELRELEELEGEPRSLAMDQHGLGVQQLYVILAYLVLGGTFVAALEEPEAHLHLPTSGRDLRALLQTVVDEGFVEQLFITTHSELFDLDPTCWWHVTQEAGVTRVERSADWEQLAHEHLFQPGPARRAMEEALRAIPEDSPVFLREDGTTVDAATIQRLIQQKSSDADLDGFLDLVYGAALRIVRADVRRKLR